MDGTRKHGTGYLPYTKENGFPGEIKVKQSARRKKRWCRKGIKASYKEIPTIYVFGKHHEDGKEFVWRVPESKREQFTWCIIGGRVAVSTKYGKKIVTITRIEELSECPVDDNVRKVIGW